MSLRAPFTCVSIAILLGVISFSTARATRAQEIDFSRIGAFESMGTGTIRGGTPAKTLVDDDEQHAILLTIWDSDTDAKVSWKPVGGGAPQTTTVRGTGVRVFQTDGQFKIQALGQSDQRAKYDYVLLRLRKE
jgi:hypothetical protein